MCIQAARAPVHPINPHVIHSAGRRIPSAHMSYILQADDTTCEKTSASPYPHSSVLVSPSVFVTMASLPMSHPTTTISCVGCAAAHIGMPPTATCTADWPSAASSSTALSSATQYSQQEKHQDSFPESRSQSKQYTKSDKKSDIIPEAFHGQHTQRGSPMLDANFGKGTWAGSQHAPRT